MRVWGARAGAGLRLRVGGGPLRWDGYTVAGLVRQGDMSSGGLRVPTRAVTVAKFGATSRTGLSNSAVQVKDSFAGYWRCEGTVCFPFHQFAGTHGPGDGVAPLDREFPLGSREIHGHITTFGQVN